MSDLTPRVTRGRLLGALVILVIASVVLIPLGVEPRPYLSGLVIGVAAVALFALLVSRRRKNGGAGPPGPPA